MTGSGCEGETTQREEGPGGLSVLVGWGGKGGGDDHHGDSAGGADGRKEEGAAGVGGGHKPAPPEGGHLLSAVSDTRFSSKAQPHTGCCEGCLGRRL